jgi:hypothetical protein
MSPAVERQLLYNREIKQATRKKCTEQSKRAIWAALATA